eukprot:TRINITY_DN3049_c0_g1_i1.p1 TRINITY_DN3049_c0_g1~~TRINITY_DN3049_c0_g1_i1.p1  ORF type:complete len:875 (+),score=216.13 TRINITY_DN3049_c0_g1_i1:119-2626(+)
MGLIEYERVKRYKFVMITIILALLGILILTVCVVLGAGIGLGLFDVDDAHPVCVASKDGFNLVSTVVPVHYYLQFDFTQFQPQLNNTYNTYNGTEIITLNVSRRTSCVQLHSIANFTTIDKVYIGNARRSYHLSYTNVSQIVTITFASSLPIGLIDLEIHFTSYLPLYSELNSAGMYYGAFPESPQEYFIATQFQPAWARFSFPCFDEPRFKTTYNFSISTLSSSNYTVLTNSIESKSLQHINNNNLNSNTNIQQQNPISTIHFETTPLPISTYLVAIVVGNFSYLEIDQSLIMIQNSSSSKIQNSKIQSIRFRSYAHPTQISSTSFALNQTLASISFFSSFLSIPYSFPKLDSVAIPHRSGAMENSGLILYAYNRFIIPTPITPSNLPYSRSALSTIYHEVAHQWFGNLVTCETWSTAFQNEAFATYYSVVAGEGLMPDWDWNQDFYQRGLRIMAADENGLNQAVIKNENLTTAQELGFDLDEAFDDITYSKGARILFMFRQFLKFNPNPNSLKKSTLNFSQQQKNFKKFINNTNPWDEFVLNYLKWNENKAVDLDTMLYAMNQSQIPPEITSAFKNWMLSPGFPLIQFNYTLNTSTNILTIYLHQSPNSPYQKNDSFWSVPIFLQFFTFEKNNNSVPVLELWVNLEDNETRMEIDVSKIENGSKIDYGIGNAEMEGFFVVKSGNWAGILEALERGMERRAALGVIGSVFSLGRSGHETFVRALEVTEAIGKAFRNNMNNTDYYKSNWQVLEALESEWRQISPWFDTWSGYGQFRSYILSLLKSIGPTWTESGEEGGERLFVEKWLLWQVMWEEEENVREALEIWRESKGNVSE